MAHSISFTGAFYSGWFMVLPTPAKYPLHPLHPSAEVSSVAFGRVLFKEQLSLQRCESDTAFLYMCDLLFLSNTAHPCSVTLFLLLSSQLLATLSKLIKFKQSFQWCYSKCIQNEIAPSRSKPLSVPVPA